MSPGLRPPPLFRCAEHPADVIDQSTCRSAANQQRALVRRAPGAPRSEINEEPKAGDIRGGEHPVSCARAPNKSAPNTSNPQHNSSGATEMQASIELNRTPAV